MSVVTKTNQKSQEIALSPIIEEPRLPYHAGLEKAFGISRSTWRILCNVTFPNAKSIEGIIMAARYCADRHLDVLKKPVHIVPIYDSKRGEFVESVWPGIGEYRITAMRCTDRPYAGCDETEFGPPITKTFSGTKDKWEGPKGSRKKTGTENIEVELEFPEWARVTVYRLVGGTKCAFVGPRVRFEETFSPAGRGLNVPNDMWCKRPEGQLEKCAEAAALRKAFPEENLPPTADEMEGKEVSDAPVLNLPKEFQQQAVSQQVDEHMSNISDATVEEEMPIGDSRQESAEPNDWEAIYEELAPGVTNAKTPIDLKMFMEENAEQIQKMGQLAGSSIVGKWVKIVNERNTFFAKKK